MNTNFALEYPGYIPPEQNHETLTAAPIFEQDRPRGNRFARFFKKISISLFVMGVGFLIYSYGPSVYYLASGIFRPEATSQVLASQDTVDTSSWESNRPEPSSYQPVFNAQLSKEPKLTISTIGVSTKIQEAVYEDYETALRKGVWRVSHFGTPSERKRPFILAAHRFGYLAWSNSFRHYNSFYNLPNVKDGDTIEVIWKQRKYIYKIYAGSEGEEIQDYNADIILYTCKDLTSPIRIFKYGKLLEI